VLPTKVRLIWLSSFRRRVLEIGQSETRIVCGDHVYQQIGMKIFREQSTNICRITTCNKRCINRVHLTFSLYTKCQNRPCGKEFNTIAFVNLLICNVNVNVILWRNLNVVFMKLFPHCYCREHLIFLMPFVALTSRLVLNTLTLTLSSCPGAIF
jgi:hypothetical protein